MAQPLAVPITITPLAAITVGNPSNVFAAEEGEDTEVECRLAVG